MVRRNQTGRIVKANLQEVASFNVVSAAKIRTMGQDLNIERLLLRIIVVLVDAPNEAHVTSVTTKAGTVLQMTVAPSDVGKVIGKDGRIARALRVLLSAMGIAARERYVLNIITGL